MYVQSDEFEQIMFSTLQSILVQNSLVQNVFHVFINLPQWPRFNNCDVNQIGLKLDLSQAKFFKIAFPKPSDLAV